MYAVPTQSAPPQTPRANNTQASAIKRAMGRAGCIAFLPLLSLPGWLGGMRPGQAQARPHRGQSLSTTAVWWQRFALMSRRHLPA